MPKLAAGRLRHRLRIVAPSRSQDPATGALVTGWTEVAIVAAAIEPLSARDFIAAQSLKSRVSVRIIIRYRPGLTHDMCLVHPSSGLVYVPAGFLADPETGREYLTIPCSWEA